MYTTQCVYCLKRPATHWHGHVVRLDRKGYQRHVLAGWCETHHDNLPAGFSGIHSEAMGAVSKNPGWPKK